MRNQSTAAALVRELTRTFLASGAFQSVAASVLRESATPPVAQAAKGAAQSAANWLAIGAAAFILGSTATGFLLAAAYLLLKEELGAVAAFGVLGFLLWSLVIAVLLYVTHVKPKPLDSTDGAVAGKDIETAADAAARIGAEIEKITEKHPFWVVAAAFGVGLILAQPTNDKKPS